MKLRTLFLINGVLTALYAVMLLFMPDKFFEMRGMHGDAYALFVTRLMGPSQVGYAFLSIAAGRSRSPETHRLMAIVNAVTWTLGLAIFLIGKLTLEMNAMVWMDIGLAAVFSLAFAYFAFFNPESSRIAS